MATFCCFESMNQKKIRKIVEKDIKGIVFDVEEVSTKCIKCNRTFFSPEDLNINTSTVRKGYTEAKAYRQRNGEI